MDKPTYWKNRKANKRGQGEYPQKVVKYHTVQQWAELKQKEKSEKS